jgi:hypothetical protein
MLTAVWILVLATVAAAGAQTLKSREVVMQAHLAEHSFGRIVLHLLCAYRDRKYQWHWRGVLRELGGKGLTKL